MWKVGRSPLSEGAGGPGALEGEQTAQPELPTQQGLGVAAETPRAGRIGLMAVPAGIEVDAVGI